MYLLRGIKKGIADIKLEKGVNTLGRKEDNSVVLPYRVVSSYHAKISVSDKQTVLEDIGSSNGTFLNGDKLKAGEQYVVLENDIIFFADEEISYKVENSTDTEVFRTKESFTIGRAKTNDIVLESSVVSSLHLTVVKNKAGKWIACDENSTNGTFIDTPHNRISEIEVLPDRVFYLGTYKLSSNQLLEYIKQFQTKQIEDVAINKDKITVGRDPQSDICITHPSVSSKHALISKESDGEYYVEDLDSTNGTFLNGKRVLSKTKIKKGDELLFSIYSYTFDFENANAINSTNTLDGFTLEAKNITKTIKDGIHLLDDVSFTIYPGEFVGLMGLSGAGKTTLLKALNGNDKPTKGSSYINGIDLYENYHTFKSAIGYVPQDDIVHPELTVYQALEYYAKLRLPNDMKPQEIKNLILTTLEKLGLKGTENTVIGSPDTEKGISGGQRKRVNLAMELLADPKIIFLDEPTSGLSAVDTKMVMELLRKLADSGKTIIITIHQPSFDNYKIMDHQIILSYGKLAYFGPTYPNSIEFFNQQTKDKTTLLANPDNALIGLYDEEEKCGEIELDSQKQRNQKGIFWKNTYQNSKEHGEYVKKREGETKQNTLGQSFSTSYFKQFVVLSSRFLKIKLKDKVNTLILLLQAPLIGLMIAMLFSKDAYSGSETMPGMAATLLFVLAISAIWFGTINASREIVAEKAIYARERMIGLAILPYILSKFMVLMILCLFQSFLLVGVTFVFTPFDIGLDGNFLDIVFLVFMTSLSGLSIGLLVSAVSKSQAQALALVPLVLLPMIIFGGGMMSVKQMDENKNPVAYSISQLTPTRWALEEMTSIYQINNDPEVFCENRIDSNSRIPNAMENCLKIRDLLDKNYGSNTSSSSTIYSVLFLYIVFPLILIFNILKRRDNV